MTNATKPSVHQPRVTPVPINVQDMIGEVAKRHNIMLKSDDPALVLITLFELVSAHTGQAILHDLTTAQNAITSTMVEQTEAAKTIAAKIVNEGGDFIAEKIQNAGTQMAPTITQAVITGLAPTLKAIQKASDTQARNNRISAWCACLSVGAALMVLLLVIFK